ncbi:FtsW/RodA/SpoVE family cell cycle protein [Buchananella felis]|uniref:FtsW/RodA/SpoVE family cell cycle protein n=1 Tax=Buchananella felis TaxID=3231492 RepID=UPI003527DFEE
MNPSNSRPPRPGQGRRQGRGHASAPARATRPQGAGSTRAGGYGAVGGNVGHGGYARRAAEQEHGGGAPQAGTTRQASDRHALRTLGRWLSAPFVWLRDRLMPTWERICALLARPSSSPSTDRVLLVVTLVGFLIVGVLLSTSVNAVPTPDEELGPFKWVPKYFMFQGAGMVLLLLAAAIPWRTWNNKFVVPAFMALAIGVQLFTSFFGVNINGNRAWLRIGSVLVQPSEFHKVVFALYIGWLITQPWFSLKTWQGRAAMFGPVLLSIGSVLIGKDVGTSLMFVAIAAVGMWLSGLRMSIVAAVGAVAGTVMGLVVYFDSERASRFARSFRGRVGFPEGTYPEQEDKAVWALATGGVQGTGPGQSRFKWGYLEHFRSDYIFAILGEEYGLIGALIFLFLFVLFIYALFRIAARAPHRSAQVFGACVATYLGVQGFINMGMATGVLPVIGVPLPFISEGGSSLVSSLWAVGFFFAINRASSQQQGAGGASRWTRRKSGAVVARKGS